MINYTNVSFIKSSPDISYRPEVLHNEVLFVGKSNVGKSSLINALTGRKNLAFVSSKPGHTLLLNYYLIDNKFYLVDAPGYGYTASGTRHASNFGNMMETYFDNEQLKLVMFLIDSRHEPGENDIEFYNFVKENNIPFVIVLTKGDKLNQSERSKAIKNVNVNFPGEQYVLTSVNNTKSIETLRGVIAKYVE